MKISKDDIKRLKSADRICFDYYYNQEHDIPVSKIRATKKLNDEWDNERTVEVNVESSFTSIYKNKIAQCFHMIHTPQMDRPWQTIAGLLRENDEIELQWCKGYGDCNLLKSANITVDYLYLHIYRENGKGLRQAKYSFFVDYGISRRDRLTAMIREL